MVVDALFNLFVELNKRAALQDWATMVLGDEGVNVLLKNSKVLVVAVERLTGKKNFGF